MAHSDEGPLSRAHDMYVCTYVCATCSAERFEVHEEYAVDGRFLFLFFFTE